MPRVADTSILCGFKNTGKTTKIKALIEHLETVLIFPANDEDPAWSGYDELHPVKGWKIDENDYEKKRKKPVYGIPELNDFKGQKVVRLTGYTKPQRVQIYQDVINDFRGDCIVTDDFKNYIASKGTISTLITDALGASRHRGVDFLFACHSMNLINGDLLAYLNRIYLCRTNEEPSDSLVKKLPSDKLAEVLEVKKRVDSIASKGGDAQFYCEEISFV